MDMKIIKSEKKICSCCMEEHEVKTVLVMEQATFKNSTVEYEASYFFCELAEELYMDEQQMQDNDIKLKDAYRKKEGLLTSAQIIEIRAKYGISQSDLCLLLGWGGKTITRYESHQVQDKAHDTILKKIDQDPEWFISLLNGSKSNLSEESYRKYLAAATSLYEEDQDAYLRKAIEANYARFLGNQMFHGNTDLSLDTDFDIVHVKEELADVLVYCRNMLDKLELDEDEIINEKMTKNEAKYPVEKAKGNAAKYDRL